MGEPQRCVYTGAGRNAQGSGGVLYTGTGRSARGSGGVPHSCLCVGYAFCGRRSPSRLCSRDGKICCYGDALSTILLLACFCTLLPTFRFSFLSFLFSCIPVCLSSSFSIFFVAHTSRVAFFCCALVPSTLALDLPTLIL